METSFILIVSTIFGLIVGSFLNVCIYRIPLGQSIMWPASHCPKCNKNIKFYDNIPVLSYLILGGKCRFCKEPISIQYPIIEFITGALTLLVVCLFGLTLWTFVLLLVLYSLIVLSVIDLQTMTIPDRFSIGLAIVGLAVSFINPIYSGSLFHKFLISLLGASVGFFGLWLTAIIGQLIFKKESLGGGDIKLMAGIGALSGVQGVICSLIIASFAGIIYYGILMLLKKSPEDRSIPFGPFLSVGLFVNLLVPNLLRYIIYY